MSSRLARMNGISSTTVLQPDVAWLPRIIWVWSARSTGKFEYKQFKDFCIQISTGSILRQKNIGIFKFCVQNSWTQVCL